MTIDSNEAGSEAEDDAGTAGPRNTRNECNDIFSEHFISLRAAFSVFSTAGSTRGMTVQYSTCRSSASGVGRSMAAGTAELLTVTQNLVFSINMQRKFNGKAMLTGE